MSGNPKKIIAYNYFGGKFTYLQYLYANFPAGFEHLVDEATTVELCQLKPVFYVIAEESDFKEKDKKRDPILLAQSPFGVYYDILGAWDKEMLLLSEL